MRKGSSPLDEIERIGPWKHRPPAAGADCPDHAPLSASSAESRSVEVPICLFRVRKTQVFPLSASVKIRLGDIADFEALAHLFCQLGYPEASEGLTERLETLLADPRADILVADDTHTLVGLATTFFVPVAHESGPWCRITALVVDVAHRGRGVGEALVVAAEQAARRAGCVRIEATSAVHRSDAHQFYEHLGYTRESEHFLKQLQVGRDSETNF